MTPSVPLVWKDRHGADVQYAERRITTVPPQQVACNAKANKTCGMRSKNLSKSSFCTDAHMPSAQPSSTLLTSKPLWPPNDDNLHGMKTKTNKSKLHITRLEGTLPANTLGFLLADFSEGLLRDPH
eukprot:877981-Amphidinium_carterae.2